jgi:hypothetical protein
MCNTCQSLNPVTTLKQTRLELEASSRDYGYRRVVGKVRSEAVQYYPEIGLPVQHSQVDRLEFDGMMDSRIGGQRSRASISGLRVCSVGGTERYQFVSVPVAIVRPVDIQVTGNFHSVLPRSSYRMHSQCFLEDLR